MPGKSTEVLLHSLEANYLRICGGLPRNAMKIQQAICCFTQHIPTVSIARDNKSSHFAPKRVHFPKNCPPVPHFKLICSSSIPHAIIRVFWNIPTLEAFRLPIDLEKTGMIRLKKLTMFDCMIYMVLPGSSQESLSKLQASLEQWDPIGGEMKPCEWLKLWA